MLKESFINNIIKQGLFKDLEENLKNKNIDVNYVFENGYSLLAKVLYSKNNDLLRVLIDNNVDVNMPYRVTLKKNEGKAPDIYYPVMIPVIEDNEIQMEILIKNGVQDVYNKDSYENLLDIFDEALTKKSHKVLELMLKLGIRKSDPFIYLKEHNPKNIAREPIAREIKVGKIALLALKEGYADNLRPFMLIKLLEDYAGKAQYKPFIETLPKFEKNLNNEVFFQEQMFRLFASYVHGSEREDMKIKEHILPYLEENSVSDLMRVLISARNVAGFKVLEKHNILNKETLNNKYSDFDVFNYLVESLISDQDSAIKIAEILLKNGIDIDNEKKMEYVLKYLPDLYAEIEKKQLEESFATKSSVDAKPKVNRI